MNKFSLTLTALLLASGSALAQQATDAVDPEGPTVLPTEETPADQLSEALETLIGDAAAETDAEAEADADAEAEADA
ncbi:MAG: hypothetical protein Q4F71_08835, partial [Paracoccus sp. (in: a-proteobacteria)]|nr:hypothetical protein [Paracoccus sp. (in: a-proteobacteria)]